MFLKLTDRNGAVGWYNLSSGCVLQLIPTKFLPGKAYWETGEEDEYVLGTFICWAVGVDAVVQESVDEIMVMLSRPQAMINEGRMASW
jgi:hypothetical protein